MNNASVIRVTVVIAAYNAESYLHIAVDSVLRQTEQNFEIIIIDDCSRDGTWQVAEKYAGADARIRAVKMAQNGGQYLCMNHAIGLAKGEWVAILDSDDWYESERLKKLLDEAEASGANIATDNLLFYDNSAKAYYQSPLNAPRLIDRDIFIKRSNPLVHNRSDFGLLKPVFRVSTLKKHSITYLEVRNGGDYYFLLSWLIHGERILLLPEALYYYVEPVGSMSRQLSHIARKPYPFLNFKTTNDLFLERYKMLLTPEEHHAIVSRGKIFVELERSNRFKERLKQKKFKEAASVYVESPLPLTLVLALRCMHLFKRLHKRKHVQFFTLDHLPLQATPIDIWHNILWSKYKGEVFSSLYALSDKREFDLRFVQIAETSQSRIGLSGVDLSHHRYPYTLLFKGVLGDTSRIKRIATLFRMTLQSNAKIVLLAGYDKPEYWMQLLLLHLKHRKVGVFCDSTIYDREQSKLRSLLKRMFFRAVDGIFCYGTRSRDYVIAYGANPSYAFKGCQAAALPMNYSAEDALEHRMKLASTAIAPRYLYVGRLSFEKGLDTLLSAFSYALKQYPKASLILVGSGTQRSKLEEQVNAIGVGNAVTFAGSLSGDALFEEYSKATCLMLPSTSEPWGLVVNEALSYGCPAIVSDICGCIPELIIDGKTGFSHRPGDMHDLAQKMIAAPIQFANTSATARECLALMAGFTPKDAAANILSGIQTILSQGT